MAPALFVAKVAIVAGGGGQASKELRPTRMVLLTQLGRRTPMVWWCVGRRDLEGDCNAVSVSFWGASLG
jgi:hypothetical protein